jgi:DNA-directed RNA polymerase specialized sigma54-like protein
LKKSRLVGFVIFILIGFVLGLIYGWVLNPAEVKNTSLSSLRVDYKADYIVMVSEIYSGNHNLDAATTLLKAVSSNGNTLKAVQEALLVGQQFGFSEREMRSLAALEMALTGSGSEVTP